MHAETMFFFAPHGGAENVDVDVDRDGRGAENFRPSTGRWSTSTFSGRRRPRHRPNLSHLENTQFILDNCI